MGGEGDWKMVQTTQRARLSLLLLLLLLLRCLHAENLSTNPCKMRQLVSHVSTDYAAFAVTALVVLVITLFYLFLVSIINAKSPFLPGEPINPSVLKPLRRPRLARPRALSP